MPDFTSHSLLATDTLRIWDVQCPGTCRGPAEEEYTSGPQLVFTYRGLFIHHLGRSPVVAEPNQLLLMNGGEGYRISHPVAGGDCCLSLDLDDDLLEELTPAQHLRGSLQAGFATRRVRIDPRAQALAALLRHGLASGTVDQFEAECLALTLVRRSLGERTSHAPAGSWSRQRIVDRAKIVLASDLGRRWTLAEIGAELGVSPVYLTQLFRQVEGVPLYRYQLRLRLARALDLLPRCEDLTRLGLELGFSSHSHFTSAFRQAFGHPPTRFRQVAG